jgi:carbamoyltransferase
MIILGINAYHADSSAAIFVNGQLVAAIEEERFKRVKHWAGFPQLAIEFCLKEAGISYEQVDHFCIGRDPKAKFFKKILYLASHPREVFQSSGTGWIIAGKFPHWIKSWQRSRV